ANHFSRGNSSIGTAGAFTPALLNNKSRRPYSRSIVSNNACTLAGSVTSVGTANAVCPRAAASATRDCKGSGRRPAATTVQPSSSNARAVTRPTPLPAPVTRAIFFDVGAFTEQLL